MLLEKYGKENIGPPLHGMSRKFNGKTVIRKEIFEMKTTDSTVKNKKNKHGTGKTGLKNSVRAPLLKLNAKIVMATTSCETIRSGRISEEYTIPPQETRRPAPFAHKDRRQG